MSKKYGQLSKKIDKKAELSSFGAAMLIILITVGVVSLGFITGVEKTGQSVYPLYDTMSPADRINFEESYKRAGSHNVEDSLNWAAAGITPTQVQDWRDIGVYSGSSAKGWTDAGYSVTQAGEWRDVGVLSSSSADEWQNNGFNTPADVQTWKDVGVTFHTEATSWSNSGVTPSQVSHWEANGVTSSTVGYWKNNGYSAVDAGPWIDAGVNSGSDANQWNSNGFNAEQAGTWVDQGIKSANVASNWRDANFDAASAKSWQDAGYTYTKAADWVSNGVTTPTAAQTLTTAGHLASDVAQWRSEGNIPSQYSGIVTPSSTTGGAGSATITSQNRVTSAELTANGFVQNGNTWTHPDGRTIEVGGTNPDGSFTVTKTSLSVGGSQQTINFNTGATTPTVASSGGSTPTTKTYYYTIGNSGVTGSFEAASDADAATTMANNGWTATSATSSASGNLYYVKNNAGEIIGTVTATSTQASANNAANPNNQLSPVGNVDVSYTSGTGYTTTIQGQTVQIDPSTGQPIGNLPSGVHWDSSLTTLAKESVTELYDSDTSPEISTPLSGGGAATFKNRGDGTGMDRNGNTYTQNPTTRLWSRDTSSGTPTTSNNPPTQPTAGSETGRITLTDGSNVNVNINNGYTRATSADGRTYTNTGTTASPKWTRDTFSQPSGDVPTIDIKGSSDPELTWDGDYDDGTTQGAWTDGDYHYFDTNGDTLSGNDVEDFSRTRTYGTGSDTLTAEEDYENGDLSDSVDIYSGRGTDPSDLVMSLSEATYDDFTEAAGKDGNGFDVRDNLDTIDGVDSEDIGTTIVILDDDGDPEKSFSSYGNDGESIRSDFYDDDVNKPQTIFNRDPLDNNEGLQPGQTTPYEEESQETTITVTYDHNNDGKEDSNPRITSSTSYTIVDSDDIEGPNFVNPKTGEPTQTQYNNPVLDRGDGTYSSTVTYTTFDYTSQGTLTGSESVTYNAATMEPESIVIKDGEGNVVGKAHMNSEGDPILDFGDQAAADRINTLQNQYASRQFLANFEYTLTHFQGLSGWSRLLWDEDDEWVTDWRNGVDDMFQKSIIGDPEGWVVSQFCEAEIESTPSNMLVVETPTGLISTAAHIEAERESALVDENGTSQYLYHITFVVNNPRGTGNDKTYGDIGVTLWLDQSVNVFPNGLNAVPSSEVRYTGSNAIIQYSDNLYSEACLRFDRPLRSFGDDNDYENSVCTSIIEVTTAASSYTPSTRQAALDAASNSSSSTSSSSNSSTTPADF